MYFYIYFYIYLYVFLLIINYYLFILFICIFFINYFFINPLKTQKLKKMKELIKIKFQKKIFFLFFFRKKYFDYKRILDRLKWRFDPLEL